MDRIEGFWAALRELTFAETVKVAETMRDAWEAGSFETNDVHDWSFLLNTAREIAEYRDDLAKRAAA